MDAPEVSAASRAPVGWRAAGTWWILGLCVTAVIAASIQILSGDARRGSFLIVLAFVVCGAGAVVDAATRRIPNELTYPAILLGLGLNSLLPLLADAGGWARAWDTAVVWAGSTGTWDGLAGFGLCAAIGVVSFMVRGLGGGDVKLLGALGAMLGLDEIVAVLFNTLLVAAVIGIVNWAVKGTLIARVQVVANNLLLQAASGGRIKGHYPFKPTEAPFGFALLIGLTLAQFVALHRVLFSVSW